MAETIKVKAAGMFTPQEEGDCKLTIIIPKEDKAAQDFAFTRLRYQEVEIGLATAPALITEPLSPGDIRMKIEEHQRAISNLVVMMMNRLSVAARADRVEAATDISGRSFMDGDREPPEGSQLPLGSAPFHASCILSEREEAEA